MNGLIVGSSFLGSTGNYGAIKVSRAGTVPRSCKAASDNIYDLIIVDEGACVDSSSDWVELIGLLRGALVVNESDVLEDDIVHFAAGLQETRKRSTVMDFACEVVGELESCIAILKHTDCTETVR